MHSSFTIATIFRVAAIVITCGFSACQIAEAGIFGIGYFSNEVYLFDENTGAKTVFNTMPSANLTGIAVNPNTGRVYVSSQGAGVFTFDGVNPNASISTLAGTFGLFQTGIAVNPLNNNVYINSFNGVAPSIRVFNSDGSEQTALSGSGMGGLLWRAGGTNGSLLIGDGFLSSFGAPNITSIDLDTLTPGLFSDANPTLPINQLAADSSGRVYAGTTDVGGGAGGNVVLRYDAAGNLINDPWLTVTSGATIPPPTGNLGTTSPFTSPAGVAVNDGFVFVGVQGTTQPALGYPGDGAVLKYDLSGNLIPGFSSGLVSINGLAIQSVPEPSTVSLIALSSGFLVYRIYRNVRRRKSAIR